MTKAFVNYFQNPQSRKNGYWVYFDRLRGSRTLAFKKLD
jgi:hypothetical protein